MTIEFSNATPAKQSSTTSNILLGLSFVFLFAPISLIVLGYYKSLPTGSLISPIPQGVISNQINPQVSQANQPVLANPSSDTNPTNVNTTSNSQEKTAIIKSNTSEAVISEPQVLETSQIYLTNKNGDKSLYSIKSKTTGQFTVVSNTTSSEDRQVDYHIVNP